VRSGPSLADEIKLIDTKLCKIQASADRETREARIMLDPADALLGNCKQQLAVTHNARGRIVHLRIIETKCNHRGPLSMSTK
jgi:hypothetical protein